MTIRARDDNDVTGAGMYSEGEVQRFFPGTSCVRIPVAFGTGVSVRSSRLGRKTVDDRRIGEESLRNLSKEPGRRGRFVTIKSSLRFAYFSRRYAARAGRSVPGRIGLTSSVSAYRSTFTEGDRWKVARTASSTAILKGAMNLPEKRSKTFFVAGPAWGR